jgi:esterase/lipase
MKKFLKILLGILVVLTIAYFMGPKPAAPKLAAFNGTLPAPLAQLEQSVRQGEVAEPGIRPDNEARIVWADSAAKQKTGIALLYLHGFSASQEEGDPVHRNVARQLGANLYLARLAGHGVWLGDSTMATITADDLYNSAEKALAIAQKLGDTVVVMATSFGAALALQLASAHPEIKALIAYSPCVKIYDDKAELIDNPWGMQLGKLITGSYYRKLQPQNPDHDKYWNMYYHMNGVLAIQNFLTNAMNPATFAKVKCPVFMGYYYKNETEQDKVVSVPAMLKMFEQLGTSPDAKTKVAFSAAGNHVLASPVLSKDVAGVEAETVRFLKEVVFTGPKNGN